MNKIHTLNEKLFEMDFPEEIRNYLEEKNLFTVNDLVKQSLSELQEEMNDTFKIFLEIVRQENIIFDEKLTPEELEIRLSNRKIIEQVSKRKQISFDLIKDEINFQEKLDWLRRKNSAAFDSLNENGIHNLNDLLSQNEWTLLKLPYINTDDVKIIIDAVHGKGLLFEYEMQKTKEKTKTLSHN